MKKIKRFIAIVLFLVIAISFSPRQANAQVRASVSFQFFYDNLSPYGIWVEYPQYGYVWHPNAERGFCPYRTRGHWVWSNEYEWIWVSDYEWGWAAFHYGRWFYDARYGWLWMPDYDWSPAWVAWRSGDDYYGWAPLGPGFNISFSFSNYSPPAYYWCFAPRRYITSPAIYNYCVSPQRNVTIINNTRIINNYRATGGPGKNVFVNGPGRSEVEKITHRGLTPVNFRESSRPGRTEIMNNAVVIYKPTVNATGKSSARPSKVVPIEKMKRIDGGQMNQPIRNEPVREQPIKNKPVGNEPTNNQPVKKAIKNQLMRNEAVREQPVKNRPVKNEPINNQPVKNQPMRNEPVKNQPMRNEPARNQPVRNEPVKNQPMSNEPVRNQPVRNEPVKNQPMRNEPARNQPVRNEPVRNQPVGNEPAKNPAPKNGHKKDG